MEFVNYLRMGIFIEQLGDSKLRRNDSVPMS
jgi:hypothetical protein